MSNQPCACQKQAAANGLGEANPNTIAIGMFAAGLAAIAGILYMVFKPSQP